MDNKAKFDNKFLNDVVPILQIEDNIIINKDGRVAIGFEMVGSKFEEMEPEHYESFKTLLDSALCSLPENYIVQKIDVYYDAFYPQGRNPKNFKDKKYFEKATVKYFAQRPVLRQRSYIFVVSDTLKNHKQNPLSTLFSKGNKVDQKVLEGVGKRKVALESYGKSFIETIRSTGGITIRQMEAQDITNLYYQMLNLEFKDEAEQPYKDILNDKNALVIGEKKLNIITMQEMGEDVEACLRNDYGVWSPYLFRLGIYLEFPHITVTSFMRENTVSTLSKLDRQTNMVKAFIKVGGQASEVKAVELESFTADARSRDLKFLSISLSVMVYAMSEEVRERRIQAVRDALRKTFNSVPLVEAFDNANSYFACMPGAAGDNLRWLMSTSDLAACYFNPTHEFISRAQGDYICDRFRNLVYIDLFDRDLNNQNAIVIGPSGSGKSYTMGHFILQRYERKERQFIIDVGGSYKNIFEALGSDDPNSDVKYFEYSEENPISFNPFLSEIDEKGNYIFNDDKSNVLLTLFGLIIKDDHNGINVSLGKSEWPIYESLLAKYYAYINSQPIHQRVVPNVAGFFAWADSYRKENKDNVDLQRNLDRIGFANAVVCCDPFITGRYRQLLNSQDTLDISDYKLVCFDMAKVKDVKSLYPIVSFLLIELVMDMIRKYPDDKKYFTMDEAWSMLSDSMGSFVEYLYRTIRKNNGSMTIITQGVTELKGDVGETIKTKCDTKIILNHKGDARAIEAVGMALGFTTSEMDKIASIRVTSDCREIFIKQGANSACFVLEVPPTEHAVLTSQPVERNHLKKLKMIYGNIDNAINQWVEDKENEFFTNK